MFKSNKIYVRIASIAKKKLHNPKSKAIPKCNEKPKIKHTVLYVEFLEKALYAISSSTRSVPQVIATMKNEFFSKGLNKLKKILLRPNTLSLNQ